MTPSIPAYSRSMQVDIAQENKSHFRLIGVHEETERRSPKIESPSTSATSSPTFLATSSRHQRIHSLILGARQVEDTGSVSGQVFPYLPKAPSLFRDSLDDPNYRSIHNPSPLQNSALANYSPTPQQQKTVFRLLSETAIRYSKMSHAVSVAHTGFQALILCGPGIGLSTFTNSPHEYPKALVPIANRPMIWYVLDWCYRMGVTDITIVTPPASKSPIETALAQNPDLTSLPSPKPDLLAPFDLEFNTPTAELLRLPEVQKTIKSDFILLPCDLICDVPGDALLESYLTSMAGIAGTGSDFETKSKLKSRNAFSRGAEGSGRRGGLSIWYNTANREESVKKEECDFMGTVDLDHQHVAPLQKITDLPNGRLRKLALTMPMSELLEQAEEDKSWKVRQSLLRRYGSVKCMTQYRDSHIYFFPYWVKEFAMENEDFESISEDLVGTWAKSEWRKASYRDQIGASKIFKQASTTSKDDSELRRTDDPVEDEIDLLSLSSTQITQHQPNASHHKPASQAALFASRVQNANPEDSIISNTTDESSEANNNNNTSSHTSTPYLPPILSYILPSSPTAPLLRRIDTTPLLLSVSLLLAKLPALDQPNSTPFSHPTKLHPTSQPPPTVRITVSTQDSLVAPNTTLSQHCTVKQACIGASCVIGAGARIQGCVIMDGAQIGEKCVLSGCVIGKKSVIGKGSVLKDCEVQDGMVVPEATDVKNEKFLVGGFEEGDGGFEGDDDDDDDDGDDDEEDE